MAVRFFYIDESYDSEKFCLSAISIRYIDWKKPYNLVRDYRRKLRDQYGLYIRQEIHARDLVAGRGLSSFSAGMRSRLRGKSTSPGIAYLTVTALALMVITLTGHLGGILSGVETP